MEEKRREAVSVAVGAAAGIGVAKVGLIVAGFTSTGVAAGSYAAGVQGVVAAGSWFATFQSAGVVGVAAIGAGPLVAIAAGGAVIGYGGYKGYKALRSKM